MAWKKQWAIDIAKEQLNDEQLILMKISNTYKEALNDVNDVLDKLNSRVKQEGPTSSILYQQQYQKALKSQIEGIYNDMYGSVYNSVNGYLKQCYEDGIVQSMYSLHKQGLDITIPIDQNEIALMASKSSVNGFKLSKKLYQDTQQMAKVIRDEMTRGLITQLSYADIARNLSNRTQQGINQCMRIARTEGHKVTMQSKMQSMAKAKDKGADIVKQWDSTLDGRTRPTHRLLDGQVRELDGQFSANGHKTYYPGGFGIASEDINCRCSVLEIPRWALDDSDDVTKLDNEAGKLLKSQKEVDLWKDANKWTNGKSNKYNQFKKAYIKKAKAVSSEPEPKLTKEQQAQIKKLEDEKEKCEQILKSVNVDKKYSNIWVDDVTVLDWKDKQYKVSAKKSYFYNKWKTEGGSKWTNLLNNVTNYDFEGKKYWTYKDKIDDIIKQIDDIKNPKIYTQMTSGGSINQNCIWKNLFNNRYDADDYYRKWADRSTYILNDFDGQKALYKYTEGSGFINRPLSGYEGSWYRDDFVGFDKVNLNYEKGKKAIDDLTKLIDKTEPLKEGIVLRRGSTPDGLIGLFEGAGFDYDTIRKACSDGSIKNFEGSVIKNHAFTSCGISNEAGFDGRIEYIIKCPAGTKMVYAEPQSYYGETISYDELYAPGMSKRGVGSEAEMIIQRGTSFKIDKITHNGGYDYKIEMTVVDQDISKY